MLQLYSISYSEIFLILITGRSSTGVCQSQPPQPMQSHKTTSQMLKPQTVKGPRGKGAGGSLFCVFKPSTAVTPLWDAQCLARGPGQSSTQAGAPRARSFVARRCGSWEPDKRRQCPGPGPLEAQAPRLPGHGLRRCFSNSDSSSRNSNQLVCGGVQGRLEVAASRSAASALILPPPPLPPGTLPGSNLTLGRVPLACDLRNLPGRGHTLNVLETHTTQNGDAAQQELGRLSPPPWAAAAPPNQSWLEL